MTESQNSSAPSAFSAVKSRFGRPQLYALLLLAAFAAQCLLQIAVTRLLEERGVLIAEPSSAGVPLADRDHSPLVPLIGSVPLRLREAGWARVPDERFPFLLFGLLFGASVWYVARRLYGNAGGYFALALYCFSPAMVRQATRAAPEVLAAWGFFGAIFAAVAAAHTLYALPGTLPWPKRWRRVLLLGAALGLGVGAQYSVALAIPVCLVLMMYLAPAGRRLEALAMLSAAVALAATILFLPYIFQPAQFLRDLVQARLMFSPARVGDHLVALGTLARLQNPAVLTMLAVALVTWFGWPRARYFGNTAPLVVALVLPLLAPLALAGEPWRLWGPSTALAFLFVGGVFADLLETRRRKLVLALALVLLAACVGWEWQFTFYSASARHP